MPQREWLLVCSGEMFQTFGERIAQVFQDDSPFGPAWLFQENVVEKPVPLFVGYHFAEDPTGPVPSSCHTSAIDSLEHSTGAKWVSKVRFCGGAWEKAGKVGGNDRTTLWTKDAAAILLEFARSCGASPTGDENPFEAARSAAFREQLKSGDPDRVRDEQNARLEKLITESTAAGPPTPTPLYRNTGGPTQTPSWGCIR
jgi:hypothetical protein